MKGPRRCRDDDGVVTMWAIAMGFTILAFVGLIVVDGGAVLRTRGHAFSVAGAAARAGAQTLDDAAAVRGEVQIDAAAAQAAALAYIDARDMTGSVAVTGNEVTVTVDDVADLQLWPGVISISATATALAIEEAPQP